MRKKNLPARRGGASSALVKRCVELGLSEASAQDVVFLAGTLGTKQQHILQCIAGGLSLSQVNACLEIRESLRALVGNDNIAIFSIWRCVDQAGLHLGSRGDVPLNFGGRVYHDGHLLTPKERVMAMIREKRTGQNLPMRYYDDDHNAIEQIISTFIEAAMRVRMYWHCDILEYVLWRVKNTNLGIQEAYHLANGNPGAFDQLLRGGLDEYEAHMALGSIAEPDPDYTDAAMEIEGLAEIKWR